MGSFWGYILDFFGLGALAGARFQEAAQDREPVVVMDVRNSGAASSVRPVRMA